MKRLFSGMKTVVIETPQGHPIRWISMPEYVFMKAINHPMLKELEVIDGNKSAREIYIERVKNSITKKKLQKSDG